MRPCTLTSILSRLYRPERWVTVVRGHGLHILLIEIYGSDGLDGEKDLPCAVSGCGP